MAKELTTEERKERNAKYEQQRKQSKKITVRMTPEQYEELQKKLELTKLKQNDFMLRCLEKKKITVIEGLPEIITELKRIGNNINQLAKLCNINKSVPQTHEITELVFEVNGVWQSLKQLKRGQV